MVATSAAQLAGPRQGETVCSYLCFSYLRQFLATPRGSYGPIDRDDQRRPCYGHRHGLEAPADDHGATLAYPTLRAYVIGHRPAGQSK